jgi:glutamyl-tRNA reductase
MIGLSHNTGAPVEVRERLAFTTGNALPEALAFLKARFGAEIECVLLSTCNRTELYVAGPNDDEDLPGADDLTRLLLAAHGPDAPSGVTAFLVERRGHRAIEHLFRVAAGLDSMILGENDIVRQVKESYSAATEAGTAGRVLNPLFHEALRVGKRARTEMDLGRGAFSVGHAAAEVARNIFGAGQGRGVLILGAGKMSETTARHLTAFGASTLLVANRTYDRAATLAEALNGRAIRYEEFASHLERVDIVIASTAAPHPIVTKSMVAEALKHRRHRDPLFFIDIAVPRDIEPEVGDLPDVFLYDIDDLQKLVEDDLAERRHRASRAEALVREEAVAFAGRIRTERSAAPLVSSMRAKMRANSETELARLRQRLPHLSENDWKAIEAAFTSVENKMLHDPTVKIREYAAAPESAEVAAKMDTVRELFGLEPVTTVGATEEREEIR